MVKVLSCLLLLLISLCANAEEYLIGVNERTVYRFKNEAGEWQGKDIELITAIFKRTPHQFKVISMPWTRVLKSLQSGEIHLTVGAALTPERQKYAHFSNQTFRYSYYSLFVRSDRLSRFKGVKSIADIADSNAYIGALRGAVYSDNYYKLIQDPSFYRRISFIDNDKNLPKFALKGRVDGYIEAEIEGIAYLNKNPEIKKQIIPLMRLTDNPDSRNFLMFSKVSVSENEVVLFDKALKDMHTSGEHKSIIEKYSSINH